MLFQQLVNALVTGGIYALIALGYSLVFGVLRLLNFAHGEVFCWGGYAAFTLSTVLMLRSFPLALLAGMVLSGFIGILLERIAFRPLRRAGSPDATSLISTIGVQVVLQNAVMFVWGTQIRPFPELISPGSKFVSGQTLISNQHVVILAGVVVLMVGLRYLLYRTRIGLEVRCVSLDRTASQLMGIDVDRTMGFVFLLGSLLAGAAGVMVASYYNVVYPTMGSRVGLKAFVAAVIGGIGSVPGAALGGFVLGLVEAIAGAYVSTNWRDALAFGSLFLMLLVRPSGLLGVYRKERV
jgi:branched-chain amino acid transport system permease protein